MVDLVFADHFKIRLSIVFGILTLGFLCSLLILQLLLTKMSLEAQVSEILESTEEPSASKVQDNLSATQQEVVKMLSISKSSVLDLCMNIENARSKATLKSAFKQFNAIIRIFFEAALGVENDTLVRETIGATGVSNRLRGLLESASSVEEALTQYKVDVVTVLVRTICA